MSLKYNTNQHAEYLLMTERIGLAWLDVFRGDTEFYSAAYWDLLTGLWRCPGPVRKTEALGFMKAIRSPHTAGKYVEAMIRRGFAVETDNPEDARSKLVVLAPDMRARLDVFLDHAITELRTSNRNVDKKGPSPKDP